MDTPLPQHKALGARVLDVDWLRILATLLIVVYHTSRLLDDMEGWHFKNPQLTSVLMYPGAIGAQFMMPLFFLLSGISTRYALGSRAVRDFLRKRFLRLVVPVMTLGWFIFSPPQVYIEASTAQNYNAPTFVGTFWQFLPHYFMDGIYGRGGYFALTGVHLWYLFWLFWFTMWLLPVFLHLRTERGQRLLGRLAGCMQRPGLVLLLGLPMALSEGLFRARHIAFLSWDEGGWVLGTHWVVLFLGYLLASEPRLRAAMRAHRWVALLVAVAALVPLAIWAPNMDSLVAGSWAYWGFWTLRSINGCWWLVAILGFASAHLSFPHPVLAIVGPAVMPTYMLHQPLIIVLGYALRFWAPPLIAKCLLILALVVVLCVVLYQFVIRRSRLLRFCFGLSN